MPRVHPAGKPFLTPSQLAEQLSVSSRTVRTLLAEGTIPSYKVGGSRRIDPVDLEKYLLAVRTGVRR